MGYAIIRIERKWFPDRRIWLEVMTKVAGYAQHKGTADETVERLTAEIETDDIEYHRLLVKPQIPIYSDPLDSEPEIIGYEVLTKEENKFLTHYQDLGESKIIRYDVQQISKW